MLIQGSNNKDRKNFSSWKRFKFVKNKFQDDFFIGLSSFIVKIIKQII